MRMKAAFRLSVEEIAVALTLIGKPELGHDLLVTQSGAAPGQDEVRSRLLAAAHSLISRGWLAVTPEGTVGLADSLARVARVLAQADFSIRYSRSYRDAEMLLTYHFVQGGIFEHRLEQGVVHSITELEDAAAVVQGGLNFFEMAQLPTFSFPPLDVPGSLLDEIKDADDPKSVSDRLTDYGVARETADVLAEDLADTEYRGSASRVEYDANDTPTADRGFLLLHGQQRSWILRPFDRQGTPFVTLMPGTADAFSREVAALL
jgi:hypothetical protein